MNNIQDDYKDKIASSLEVMVNCFERMDLTAEQIMDQISDMPRTLRNKILVTASLSGKKELAEKIGTANEMIKLKNIEKFKESVVNDTHSQFLSNMTWNDKALLLMDMGLFSAILPRDLELSEEDQKYRDIVKKSMDKDIENMRLNQDIGIAHHVQGRDIVKKSMDKDMEKMGLNQDIGIAHHVKGRDDFSIKTGSQYILRKIEK